MEDLYLTCHSVEIRLNIILNINGKRSIRRRVAATLHIWGFSASKFLSVRIIDTLVLSLALYEVT